MPEDPETAASPAPLAPGSLRRRSWRRFVRGPDPSLVDDLYVPALSEAVRYDRCCAYFSSSVLAAAARGFGRLIERLEAMGDSAPRPAVRLLVNEEVTAEDARALTETGDVSRLEALLSRRLQSPKEALEKNRLAMLGWLVKRRLLEVRVGVMRAGGGILHAKYGIVTDEAGDSIVFSGSGNETAQGLRGNYEHLEVSPSWEDTERYQEYASEFAALWKDTHPDVYTLPLPEALQRKLIRFAPREPPIAEPSNALARQKAAMIWRFVVEAPYLPNGDSACDATAMVDLWPHQRGVVQETVEAWPEGRLLCDEVGMGKTIEAILILRRLMAGRGVRRALILVPAGLLKQWQSELREKGGMVFPRLEGTTTLFWPDDRAERVSGLPEALERDVLLMSRETARTENNLPLLLAASPWDLVVLDESHAARRRKQEEGEYNSGTLLLTLLRQLQLRRRTRGFLLLSATPMQTHPWEPWDLLSVLGEGGAWLAEFAAIRDFYEAIPAVRSGRCQLQTAQRAAALIASDPGFPPGPDGSGPNVGSNAIAKLLTFASPNQRSSFAEWLRDGSPLARRMHRNTRVTLRRYFEMGLLPNAPPGRAVDDVVFDYEGHAERDVYDAVSRYINRRFDELESEKPGKGFVMTIYRRRASSSPLALEQSLERRRKNLRLVAESRAYDPDLEIEEDLDLADLDDLGEFEERGRVPSGLPSDPGIARAEMLEVERVLSDLRSLGGRDTKRDRFFDALRRVTADGRPVLIFTEYTDTLKYLRDSLVSHYGSSLACYSGDGGQVWDGDVWRHVTKDKITSSLQRGELRVLACTDAASEGLNLQAAGAVINYDLPWNPSKIEQRIGRVDRIGQRLDEVLVVNFFLKDSVDDKVYRTLRTRCGLFEHFVGAMQPVLARARRMLLGREPQDVSALRADADRIEEEPLSSETYLESPVRGDAAVEAAATRVQVELALSYLGPQVDVRVQSDFETSRHRVSATSMPGVVFGSAVETLERDRSVLPLSPFNERLRELTERLSRPGERLPLVIASYQKAGFRSSAAYWVDAGESSPVESFADLQRRIEVWDGDPADPEQWLRVERVARSEAEKRVRREEERAAQRERLGLERQLAAARLRLQRELGRYLACLGEGTSDLNQVLHRHMSRDIASAERLRKCLDRLGSYPNWELPLFCELDIFAEQLSENQKRARLLGKELDAALEDPRWLAAQVENGGIPAP